MRIDLHTHSTASDGTDTPAALIRAAAAQGLDVVALTDHDTTRGHAEAAAALPEGLDAPVSQGGTNFSGGQRQRLAIARALVRKPAIYLFDDSFSALDLATDARLRAALRPTTRDATTIIVAQRVTTIIDADLILVLEDGRIVGRGTHPELLETCTTYQEIVTSQMTAEEAA